MKKLHTLLKFYKTLVKHELVVTPRTPTLHYWNTSANNQWLFTSCFLLRVASYQDIEFLNKPPQEPKGLHLWAMTGKDSWMRLPEQPPGVTRYLEAAIEDPKTRVHLDEAAKLQKEFAGLALNLTQFKTSSKEVFCVHDAFLEFFDDPAYTFYTQGTERERRIVVMDAEKVVGILGCFILPEKT